MNSFSRVLGGSAAVVLLGGSCFAQVNGTAFDLVTIGAPGNPGYNGPDPFGLMAGRGSVGYEYRIGRTEVTTAQWMEFVNAFSTQPGAVDANLNRFVFGPVGGWGAIPDSLYSGPGRRYRLDPTNPQAGILPVYGITWREAAIFCNWLDRDKASSWAAIQTGAYDTSTFTNNPDGSFNDQVTHSPGARFWIPTHDEWVKAAHFDPGRNGPGAGGWWLYPNMSDEPLTPGVPGVGNTSGSLVLPDFGETRIPLGAYANVRSPWGLLDASGAANEWTEGRYLDWNRIIEGSGAGVNFLEPDAIYEFNTGTPGMGLAGLRIAAAVPTPGTLIACAGICVFIRRKR